jgi:predicted nucleic acid-binding protein
VGKVTLIRVYADTSVFGGVFDVEFEDASRAFFGQVRSQRFQLVTSAVVQEELALAPAEVRNLFDEMLEWTEIVDVTEAVLQLQSAYLQAGILRPRWATDALHVALATVAECALIVSWNFRHIVHFEKIPLYNAVNTLQGHTHIAIHSPREVIAYEDENV